MKFHIPLHLLEHEAAFLNDFLYLFLPAYIDEFQSVSPLIPCRKELCVDVSAHPLGPCVYEGYIFNPVVSPQFIVEELKVEENEISGDHFYDQVQIKQSLLRLVKNSLPPLKLCLP